MNRLDRQIIYNNLSGQMYGFLLSDFFPALPVFFLKLSLCKKTYGEPEELKNDEEEPGSLLQNLIFHFIPLSFSLSLCF